MSFGSGNILILSAGMLLTVSCLSSTEYDGQGAVSFCPVIGQPVRSSVEGNVFPEEMDFGVWAVDSDGNVFMENEKVFHDGHSWSSENSYLWPERSLRFMGIAPYGQDFVFDPDGGIAIESLDLSSADAQVLIAGMTGAIEKGNGGAPVTLAFYPVTAEIDFRIANGLSVETDVRLEKIVLDGVKVKGSLDTMSEPVWSVSGEASEIVVYEASEGEEDPVERDPSFFGRALELIPQNSEPRIRVTYALSTAGSSWLTGQTQETLPLKGWEPGRRYTYTVTICSGKLTYTTGISDWSENNRD